MAASPLNPKIPYHARSISLPSRSHPLTLRVEEQLHRLRSSEATSSLSSLQICHNLSGLKDLYNFVDDLLQMPLTQQALAHERSDDQCLNNVLDGSLRMLDVCGTTRDVLLQMKERAQDLQSSLRRKRGGELGLSNEVSQYMVSRKKVNKVIHKCLRDLRRVENKREFLSLLEKDHKLVAIVGVLREAETITLSVLESSLMSFVSRSRTGSKTTSGWSLVSKLMHIRREAYPQEEEADICEMEKVDISLSTLMGHRSCIGIEVIHVQNAQKKLEALELSIHDLEEGLECVFRSLIKTRVSLLNILSH